MPLDRRRRRSNYTALSLHYWLASLVDRTRAFAFILADPTGLLIAASIRGPEAEELAAVAPLVARSDPDPTPPKQYGVPMCVEKLSVEGMPMLLCAIGDRDNCDLAIRQAATGVARILAN